MNNKKDKKVNKQELEAMLLTESVPTIICALLIVFIYLLGSEI